MSDRLLSLAVMMLGPTLGIIVAFFFALFRVLSSI